MREKDSGVVTFLHLSDVHFGMRDDSGFQDRNADAVLDAVKAWAGVIDLVIFSGDLVQSAQLADFVRGETWLNNISTELRCPCFVVPGNHEIERIKANKKTLRAANRSESDFGSWKNDIYGSHPQLHNFKEWHAAWKQDSESIIGDWGTNPAINSIKSDFNGIPCQIIGINTAFLSCDNDDFGALCVDAKALNGALKGSQSDENLIVVVGHHPIEELADWNRDRIATILNQATGPHAYFHGHLHRTKSESISTCSGLSLFTSAAGAVFPSADYVKNFSIVQFLTLENKIKTTVYALNEASGSWIVDNSRSGEVPARMPKARNSLDSDSNKKRERSEGGEEPEYNEDIKDFIKIQNPFSDYSANGISANSIHQLFVERKNSLQSLHIKNDNIIEGQRGTGKTMLLRYFSAEVQYSLLTASKEPLAPLVPLFNKSKVSFGLYCLLTGGGLDRSDFQAIGNDSRSKMIFLHLTSLFIVTKLVNTLITLASSGQELQISPGFRQSLCEILRAQCIEVEGAASKFLIDFSRYLKSLRSDAYEHLASCLPGGVATKFNPWLSLTDSVIPVLEEFKSDLGLKEPVFLLIDDFDRLTASQQSAFFTAASVRQHDIVCFKFGSTSEGIKTNTTSDGRLYSEGDDYDYVHLDWVDGGLNNEKQPQYKDALKEISRKRIDSAGWPDSISLENLFENWALGDGIRAEVKSECQKEFSELKGSIKNQPFESLWTKQGNSRYFKHLASKKIAHRYAGSSTIVEVSSGIYRQFLEVCGRIVNVAISQGWSPHTEKKKAIGVQIQDRCIREWSSAMFKNLDSSGDLTNLGVAGTPVTSEHLVNLANSLTQYFRWRLLSDSKDPEVIAISIRDAINPGTFAKVLLDVAVRETLLQRRSVDYTNKGGDGRRLPTFQLNRRLVPHVGIGTKIQGRYEITCAQLELAATSTERFLEAMRRGSTDSSQFDLL